MQDFGSTTMQNPFEGYSSTLNRKRDVEESGMDMQSQETVVAQQQQGHAVMPLPKRRITDVNVPTMASLNGSSTTPHSEQPYHAFDLLPHSPQHSLNLYPNNGMNGQGAASSPGLQSDAMSGYGYYSGTIAVSNPENGVVDPNAKHVLRHIQMLSYNPSNPGSSLNSPSAHSVFTTTTDADAPFLFEHDSPDMMRDEDTSFDAATSSMAQGQQQQMSNEEMMMMQQQQAYMQHQQEQMLLQQQQQQQQEQMLLQQQQQQQQQQQAHPMFNPAHVQPNGSSGHPLSGLAGSGMFTMANPVQAAYDSYNGGFLDEFEDSMAGRYTGQSGDSYAAIIERVMGHA